MISDLSDEDLATLGTSAAPDGWTGRVPRLAHIVSAVQELQRRRITDAVTIRQRDVALARALSEQVESLLEERETLRVTLARCAGLPDHADFPASLSCIGAMDRAEKAGG